MLPPMILRIFIQ